MLLVHFRDKQLRQHGRRTDRVGSLSCYDGNCGHRLVDHCTPSSSLQSTETIYSYWSVVHIPLLWLHLG